MADYIINEARFDPEGDRAKISKLENMIESGTLTPEIGLIDRVSYRKLDCVDGRELYGPTLIIFVKRNPEPLGIAFEGTRENMVFLFRLYNINSLDSLKSRKASCYLDPGTGKIFAIGCLD